MQQLTASCHKVDALVMNSGGRMCKTFGTLLDSLPQGNEQGIGQAVDGDDTRERRT